MARRFVYVVQWNATMEVFTTSEKAKMFLYEKEYKPDVLATGIWKNYNEKIAILSKKEIK